MEEWSRQARVYEPVRVASIDGTETEVPHDAAVTRALRSQYRPDPGVAGDPDRTLFIAGLNPRTTQEEVAEWCAAEGALERCRLVRDAVTGHSRRYALVTWRRRAHAAAAWRHLHGGAGPGGGGGVVLVEWEAARRLAGWRPRRLGGGFGGRKESGQLRFGCRTRPFLAPINSQAPERLRREDAGR